MSQDVGIVVFDLQGGDYSFHFVDGVRWAQIMAVHGTADESVSHWQGRLMDKIGYLTADALPETERPDGCPEREGNLLGTAYTQTFVIEQTDITGRIIGMLTFPCL